MTFTNDFLVCHSDIMNNKVFYQHPNLMRVLGMHETVMEVMVNVLGGDKLQVRIMTPQGFSELTVITSKQCYHPVEVIKIKTRQTISTQGQLTHCYELLMLQLNDTEHLYDFQPF